MEIGVDDSCFMEFDVIESPKFNTSLEKKNLKLDLSKVQNGER